MNNFKIKFLLAALFLFGLNSSSMASTYDIPIAALIPFESTTSQSTNPSPTSAASGTQAPAVNSTVPSQAQVPASNPSNTQVNAPSTATPKTDNRSEQNDLYNRMIRSNQ